MNNNNTKISIQERTKKFAIRVINAYTQIIKAKHFNDAAVVLSKQFLRSGTSIGANCKEAISAQSRKDFISKYWIEIMIETNIVPKGKFSSLLSEIDGIIRTLVTIIKSLKKSDP